MEKKSFYQKKIKNAKRRKEKYTELKNSQNIRTRAGSW